MLNWASIYGLLLSLETESRKEGRGRTGLLMFIIIGNHPGTNSEVQSPE